MLQTTPIRKERQLPCEALYREGPLIAMVRVEAIRSTPNGTGIDICLVEKFAHRTIVSTSIDELKPSIGQRWTCSSSAPTPLQIPDQLSEPWSGWNIDFNKFILDDLVSYAKQLNFDLRSPERFHAILRRIQKTHLEYQTSEAPRRPEEPPPEPIRAKKITDLEISKGFDFDVFEEDGEYFRYINGYRKTVHLF